MGRRLQILLLGVGAGIGGGCVVHTSTAALTFAPVVNTGNWYVIARAFKPKPFAGTLSVDPGKFFTTGEAVTFAYVQKTSITASNLTPAAAWLFTTPTFSASSAGGHPLSADTGYFTITGETPAITRRMHVNTGYFISTGEAATLTKAKRLSAVTGYFVSTGEAATFKKQMPVGRNRLFPHYGRSRNIQSNADSHASTGYYFFTGEAVTFARTKKLSAATGYFVTTGEAATLAAARKLTSSTGYYIFTGEAVTVTKTRRLSGVTGYFISTGEAVVLKKTTRSLFRLDIS